MVWLEKLLIQIAVAVLTRLVAQVEAQAKERAAQEKLDFERGIANAENSRKYKEAVTRADKIKAALDLLSGNSQ